jgi:hypothetical protein
LKVVFLDHPVSKMSAQDTAPEADEFWLFGYGWVNRDELIICLVPRRNWEWKLISGALQELDLETSSAFWYFLPNPQHPTNLQSQTHSPLRLIIRLGKAGADQVQIGESQVG